MWSEHPYGTFYQPNRLSEVRPRHKAHSLSVGKPRKGWLGCVDNDLKKMSVRGWRKIARDRDAWKFVLKGARIMHRPYKQWRRELRLSKWASGALVPRAVCLTGPQCNPHPPP